MANEKIKILLVEDNTGDARLFRKALSESTHISYEITHIETLGEALKYLDEREFDIIITDLSLPDSNGIKTFRKIYKSAHYIPIVVLTSSKDESTASQCLREGAQDYIVKGQLKNNLLIRAIQYAIMRSNRRNLPTLLYQDSKQPSDEGVIRTNELICKSKVMQDIYKLIKRYSETEASVLILGESGTGKDKVAEIIHVSSKRNNKLFVKINCASIPENLLESELFGYKKGAFTGAVTDSQGKFEAADGVTIFLNEIGEISLSIQAKLLQIVEEKSFSRLGECKTYNADVRIITATNKNLLQLVKQGKFREDLYFRLKVLTLKMPPLRDRIEDIPILINHFIGIYSKKYSRAITGITQDAMEILLSNKWPGNVRELRYAIEYACVVTGKNMITLDHLPPDIVKVVKDGTTNIITPSYDLDDEKSHIINILEQTKWNRSKASKILGMSRTTLWQKIKFYNIQKKQ